MGIPMKHENPKGLHMKYIVQKVKGWNFSHTGFFGDRYYTPEIDNDVPDDVEYFVLRLDEKANPEHREACIKAVLTYAEAIKAHIPELAEDIISRYGNVLHNQK